MRVVFIAALVVLSAASGMFTWADEPRPSAGGRIPVLVELFTSEGCSSCPPADLLLQKFDRQPAAGEELIVLSEHVDYWNHIGWNDPFSASFYSDRQTIYARRLGLSTVYTPQMIVDGSTQFTGSDAALADQALAKALSKPKIALRLSNISPGGTNILLAHLETGVLPASLGLREAEIYVAVALNRAQSQVAHGENAGHTLEHVAVARSLVKVGTLRQGQAFAKNIQLRLDPGVDWGNLRLIAFLQEPGQGRVVGATLQPVGTTVAK